MSGRIALRIALGGITLSCLFAAAPAQAGVMQLGIVSDAGASNPLDSSVPFDHVPHCPGTNIETPREHGSLTGTGTVNVGGHSHATMAFLPASVDLSGQIVSRIRGDDALILPAPPPNSLFNPPRCAL